jgi:putative ABC transport system permease protein
MAQKYFGDEAPLGKTLAINFGDAEKDFIVTGVVQNIPSNSSISFDFVLPYENSPNYADLETSWTSWGAVTFIQIDDKVQSQNLQGKFGDFVKTNYQAMINTWQILGWIAKEEDALKLSLQPLSTLHLNFKVENGLWPTSNPLYSYILSGIGLIVLLIACINFTTLSIGRAASRTLEVGMRKTLGAFRMQLAKQFLGEAVLFSVIAVLTGIALAEAFLPVFNSLANKSLAIPYFENWHIYGVIAGLILVVGIAAGSYPALYLSRFQPIDTLKNRGALRGKNRLSQTLVVVQFSLSVLLIICASMMSDQLSLLKNQNPGFNDEQVVVIPTHSRGAEGEELLKLYKQKLNQQPELVGVTGNSDGFNKEPGWRAFGTADGANWQVNIMRVDVDFIKTMGMQIIDGRDFSRELTTDATQSVIVNEALVKEFGWQTPVGKRFDDFDLSSMKAPVVIGVVKDFNYASLHETIKPMVLHLVPESEIKYIFARIAPGDFAASLDHLRAAWKEIAPNKPFEYYFFDEEFDQQYRAEERWAQIVLYATAFAIVIACIGLFGLSALAAAKRTKEIGIRKVLGASVAGITGMLSKDFLKLVLIANVIAWPAAWFAMNKWLENFAYRIETSPWVFVLAGGSAMLIALLTVSFQAIKAAAANPVEALRYE